MRGVTDPDCAGERPRHRTSPEPGYIFIDHVRGEVSCDDLARAMIEARWGRPLDEFVAEFLGDRSRESGTHIRPEALGLTITVRHLDRSDSDASLPPSRLYEIRDVSLPKGRMEHPPLSRADSLTARQLEVAQLLRRGCTYQEVAEELGVAVGTVRKHVEKIYRTMGVRSRAELSARWG